MARLEQARRRIQEEIDKQRARLVKNEKELRKYSLDPSSP